MALSRNLSPHIFYATQARADLKSEGERLLYFVEPDANACKIHFYDMTGLTKLSTSSIFRHSVAPNLETDYDVRGVQIIPSHKDMITMIKKVHVFNLEGKGVTSPAGDLKRMHKIAEKEQHQRSLLNNTTK